MRSWVVAALVLALTGGGCALDRSAQGAAEDAGAAGDAAEPQAEAGADDGGRDGSWDGGPDAADPDGGEVGDGGATPVDSGSPMDAGRPDAGPPPYDAGSTSCTEETWNGHRYLFCAGLLTWEEARAWCASFDWHLAVVESEEEDAWLTERTVAYGTRRWIGLHQPDSDPDPNVGWRWVDGRPLSYAGWGTTEPNDHMAAEDCVEIRPLYESWNDTLCDSPKSYVCEWP